MQREEAADPLAGYRVRIDDIRRICRNGIRTGQDYHFVQGLQEDILATLAPEEAETQRWMWNIERLVPWQLFVRKRLRTDERAQEMLESRAQDCGYDPAAFIYAVRHPDLVGYDEVKPHPGLLRWDTACPPDSWLESFLYWEWNKPMRLDYVEYFGVKRHLAECTCCASWFRAMWIPQASGADAFLGKQCLLRLYRQSLIQHAAVRRRGRQDD